MLGCVDSEQQLLPALALQQKLIGGHTKPREHDFPGESLLEAD